jgi:hypothetical protein
MLAPIGLKRNSRNSLRFESNCYLLGIWGSRSPLTQIAIWAQILRLHRIWVSDLRLGRMGCMSPDSMHYGISRQALRVIGGTRVMCYRTAVCKFVEDLFQISGGREEFFLASMTIFAKLKLREFTSGRLIYLFVN